MVFTNRRKWSNNDQHEPDNQTKTSNNEGDSYKIDINKFLLIGEDNENKQSLNTMNALWYALTLEPVAVQNQRCSKFLRHIICQYISSNLTIYKSSKFSHLPSTSHVFRIYCNIRSFASRSRMDNLRMAICNNGTELQYNS